MRRSVRHAFVGIAAALFAAPAVRADTTTFGLSIAVARQGGAAVRDETWIREQIEQANTLFAPAGVGFRWTLAKDLRARVELHSRADRDALADETEPRGVVDVFVVGALEDVDEPGRMRKGVCWTHKPDGKRYVVISAIAPPGVLAHELGHFFGNAHTTVADNLMSYERTGGRVSFDDAQLDRIRSFSRRFLEIGRLVEAPVPRLLP